MNSEATVREKSDRLRLNRQSFGNFSFLLLGPGRGGTSLLAGLLDSHSELRVGFERFSIPYLLGSRLIGERLLPWRRKTLLQDRARTFVAACEREARRYPDRRWGNKITTEQVHGLEDHNRANPVAPVDVLEYFFRDALRHLPVIFILRDGRTCIPSKMKRAGQPLERAIHWWKYSVTVWRFLSRHHPDSYVGKYEDLLRDPESSLTEICSFLGIPYQSSMLQGTNSKLLPREYRHDAVLEEKIRAPIAPEPWHELIAPELRECGYLSD